MFDLNAKIKDDIMCWQVRNFLLIKALTLSVVPTRKNITLDMLTRAMCTTLTEDSLNTLAPCQLLCHPGITRLSHFD